MKLPSYRRIVKSDYSVEDQVLVDQLSVSINQGFDILYTAMNKRISLRDNVQTNIKDIQIKVDVKGTPTPAVKFTIDTTLNIEGLQVIKATNTKNPTVYPTGGIFISYAQVDDVIAINNITGLVAGEIYLIRIVVYS